MNRHYEKNPETGQRRYVGGWASRLNPGPGQRFRSRSKPYLQMIVDPDTGAHISLHKYQMRQQRRKEATERAKAMRRAA